jgi:hypothetical protein
VRTSANNYEKAFESWLIENRVQYVSVDQQKRQALARDKVKSFDFLLYRADGPPVITEVKGRKFKGKSLKGLKGLECWVTMEDVRGLIRWQQLFNSTKERTENQSGWETAFIFAYEFENVDVETDGAEVYEFYKNCYAFYAVKLENYQKYMTVRSPKWQTVTLPAAKFRQFAVPVRKLFGI